MVPTGAVVVVVSLMVVSPLAVGEDFVLTILHTNDIHARYDQFNTYGSPCSSEAASENKCFGGYARLVTAVRDKKNQFPNSLLLDGGDQYQGTLWFYKYWGNMTSHFMNWLGYDVMALGNHEFDRGIEGLTPFLKDVNFSIISANIDATLEPDVESRISKTVERTVGQQKIGIVGYTTEDTPDISSPGKLKFNSVVESVRQEVKRLQGEGINKIIALGHAGFTVDKQVAAIPGVDVVVGGHTNTFLYTGSPPSIEQPEGAYPFVVTKAGGQALVVQDYTFGKYLGVLHVTFDDKGEVKSYSGNPMLLDSTVEQDNATVLELQPWKIGVEADTQKVVGRTLVNLNGSRFVCRVRECNLGNLVADSMVHKNLRYPEEGKWNDVSIALMNSGGIRDSIERGKITIANVVGVLPFQNTVDAIKIKGEHLRAALEHSVAKYDPCVRSDLFGGFLQVSGLRVQYDVRKPVGQRVVSVHALCTDCLIPEFRPLDDSATYKIIVQSFIAGGGDGYKVFRDNAISTDLLGDLDSDVLIEYIKKASPITQGLEGRIVFVDQSDQCMSTKASRNGAERQHARLDVLAVLAVIWWSLM
ncbi:hypothetical protein BaRGS_00015640 [Batillaria attramentaria]|uniref:5'-nucleotidase n=1 Tax=Batillaria attramentaria TaxID=370345 RepID=A0ABD0L1Z0_9CAEN